MLTKSASAGTAQAFNAMFEARGFERHRTAKAKGFKGVRLAPVVLDLPPEQFAGLPAEARPERSEAAPTVVPFPVPARGQ